MTAPCVFFPDPEARHLCSVWYDGFWNLLAHLLCSPARRVAEGEPCLLPFVSGDAHCETMT
jgi:hypothetical protein